VRSDPVTKYARDVVAGKIVAGRPVRLACERHLRDMKSAKAKGLVWKPEKAQRILDFFPEMLVLEDGSPFVLVPWQVFVVGSLFGWYKTDGFRRYRTAYVETGKGSGKTPLAAGIGLFGLVADGEPAAEIYSAANDKDQAKIVWKDAWRMVKGSPELDRLISSPDRGDVQIGTLTIPAESSVFRPVSSEHKGLDGRRVHMALIDELHEHQTAMVVDKMSAGTKRRQNALIFEITNSGYDRTSVCWQHHEKSIKVLEGTTDDPGWFVYLCSLDEGDDWTDPKVWPKANPSLGTVLPVEYLQRQVMEAQTMPSKENIVKRLNFCIWTEQSERWLSMESWDACGGDVQVKEGSSCYSALDMASRRDLCAEAKLFGPDAEGVFDLAMRFWIPRDTLDTQDSDRTEQDRLMLRHWADQGFITLTDGNVADYDTVESDLLKDYERFDLKELAFDPWNVTQLVTHLKDKLGEERVIQFSQGFASMTSPCKELEKLLASKKLRHGGNPVLRWMASNVAIKHGPDKQIRPDKTSSRDKIDGIVALLMALGRATLSPQEGPSVYDLRHEAGQELVDSW
jgi:phage terminase large subunit-like protein